MTYSTGNLIQATDYNGFVSTTTGANVNATWNTAYGQTALSTVAAGGTISATQWASLNTTISSMASHQGTAITSRTNPVAGNIISAMANVGTDITNCYTNRANAATQGTQFTGWTGTASKTAATGSGAAAWTITFTNTITFANTTAASNFFNAGGMIKIQSSKTSTGTSSDPEWNTFVGTTCGTIYLTSTGASKTLNGTTYTGTTKIGGSGTPTTLTTGTGFSQLTSTPVTIYKQFDSGTAYSSNYLQMNASVSGAVLTLTSVWYDNGDPNGAAISGGTATTGITFGTAPTTVVTYYPPETTYLANTWGTVTVASSVA
jgi:hypothetical protein